ncbi:hypothetical protein H5410_002581 [Solanum commersonii]|uniref:Uncharacterized protein n=1 Tax=Solanum commersonii TaxID=4109 RepID=A0A9J6B2I4_SOLCO|nr:hypothetical protein H5410_002581 [Solanum commersonii]
MQGWTSPASRRAGTMGGCMSGESSQGSIFRDLKEELTWGNKVMMGVKTLWLRLSHIFQRIYGMRVAKETSKKWVTGKKLVIVQAC